MPDVQVHFILRDLVRKSVSETQVSTQVSLGGLMNYLALSGFVISISPFE